MGQLPIGDGDKINLTKWKGKFYYINGNGKWTEFTAEAITQPLVYKAMLSQSGTNAPVANIIENTLGGIPVWSRGSAGSYYMTLAGAWTENKTTTINNTVGTTGAIMCSCYRYTDDKLYYEISNAGTFADDIMYQGANYIEIKVYP